MREQLIKLLGGDMCKDVCCYDCEHEDNEKACIEHIKSKMADHLIANGVTIAVLCKDCTEYTGHRWCTYFDQAVLDNDFCSYGERRNNE